ncbi:MAG: hypothetical protein HN461_09390 [Rhodospirillaceae bacterium]|nr:hypothetical protein [Rhodospirillaceae bacterium]
MAYLLNELKSLDEKLGRQHETEKINAMLGAFSKKVEKLYYGTGYFEHATRSLKPIHINELVKSFGNDITDEKKKYAYLCDFVHPNLGVNLLISDGGLGQGRVEPDQTIVSSLIGYILELDGDMARFTDGKEAEFFDFLVFRMKYYCDELLIGSSNINNIFSRNIKKGISGTGVSSKDPITFSNVKSYSQYINALLQFLEDKEIDPLTRRGEYGAKGNNFDVYKKNGRDVWILINWQL